MPPKLNRFNVGLYNKIKKQEKDAALRENANLMNCVAEENRKLKSTFRKRFAIIIKVTDFHFAS